MVGYVSHALMILCHSECMASSCQTYFPLYLPSNPDPSVESEERVMQVQARVLHKYKAQDKDELQLRPGDTVTELVQLEQGWCRVSHYNNIIMLPCCIACDVKTLQGKLNGRTGFFPAAFVELIDQVK